MINFHHIDCNDFMKSKPDKFYDLAIVDPPYGINIGGKIGGGKPFGKNRGGKCVEPKTYRGFNDSKPPSKEYFEELMRVSKNQVIWGGNYFLDYLNATSCMIVWDKNNTGNFADAELAWTSFKTSVRIFKWTWNGMLQQNMKNKQERIHPTEKPFELYRWLLQNYAKPNDKILDTHGGSMSSAIACDMEGFDLDICELDKEYFDAGVKRFNEYKRQLVLF